MASSSDSNVAEKMGRYISWAENLIQRCSNFQDVKGMPKLRRRVQSELKYLNKLRSNSKPLSVQEVHLKSSNLSHLDGIVSVAESFPNVVSFLTSFHTKSNNCMEKDPQCEDELSDEENECEGAKKRIVVDIVCDNGFKWVKVIARKAQALHLIWAGQGQFGEKNLLEQAEEFKICAIENTVNFVTPKVAFHFTNGVTFPMCAALERLGVQVVGKCEPVDSSVSDKLDEFESADYMYNQTINYNGSEDIKKSSLITKVNLDITSLIAIVSQLTNGGANFIFQEDILTSQAAAERKEPVLPIINKFLEGKELFTCQTAVDDFKTILSTVGGDREKQRAEELMKRITIVPDCLTQRAKGLQSSGTIRERAKIIFGTGDYIKAITLTANTGFYRAACGQGVNFAVFVHQSRALTEKKEKYAKPLK